MKFQKFFLFVAVFSALTCASVFADECPVAVLEQAEKFMSDKKLTADERFIQLLELQDTVGDRKSPNWEKIQTLVHQTYLDAMKERKRKELFAISDSLDETRASIKKLSDTLVVLDAAIELIDSMKDHSPNKDVKIDRKIALLGLQSDFLQTHIDKSALETKLSKDTGRMMELSHEFYSERQESLTSAAR